MGRGRNLHGPSARPRPRQERPEVVRPLDIEFARELGYKIKLLAICRGNEEEIDARVHPTLIPEGHLLSQVSGTFNAIFLQGDAVGPCMLYGKGAGMMPTASAVVSDIMDIARNIQKGISQRLLPAAAGTGALRDIKVRGIKNIQDQVLSALFCS